MNRKFDLKSEKTIKLFFPVIFSALIYFFIIPKLPEKYFYDSYEILKIMSGQYSIYNDGSYMFTVHFFNFFNIFKLTSFMQWTLFLTLIGVVLYLLILNKYDGLKVHSWLFVLLTLALANIYIFRVSKDFIQFLVWIVIYFILLSDLKKKNFFVILLLIIEGSAFRFYYYLIAAIYFVSSLVYSRKEKINIKRTIIFLCLCLFLGITLLKIISPELYFKMINLRFSINYNRQNSVDAVTIINDLFSNNNPVFYFINYLLNFLRICFPIELLFKGLKYIPFCFYQIYLIVSILFCIKKNFNKDNYIFNCFTLLFFSYLFVVALFEPDFGSLIRHECCLSFIYFGILFFDYRRIRLKK